MACLADKPWMVGVDFSGARSDQNTWVAVGELVGWSLHVDEVQPITRADLLELLRSAPAGSVAALDFPFAPPTLFCNVLADQPRTMADVWQSVEGMEMGRFIALRDTFVAQYGELRRQCDLPHPEAYSVLHKANPNLLPMTLRGMQLLHQLRRPGVAVLALDQPNPLGLTVIECMPGASLKGLGLPYKGYKKGQRHQELRRRILQGLAQVRPVSLATEEKLVSRCLESHDCLDAVVACLTAAAYACCPGAVSTPPGEPVYRLEGWIYCLQPGQGR